MAISNKHNLKPLREEDIEIMAIEQGVEKRYRTTPKYERWLEFFLDRRNKYGYNTYLNQTLSACIAYGYNPNDRKQYLVAAQIAHKNINKYKHLASQYYESQGITVGTILDLWIEFMMKRRDVNMLYALANVMGIELPEYINLAKPQININYLKNIEVRINH